MIFFTVKVVGYDVMRGILKQATKKRSCSSSNDAINGNLDSEKVHEDESFLL